MRQYRWHHRARYALRHSLRLKLVLVFLVLALVMTAIFLAGMQRAIGMGWRQAVAPLLADYVDRLVAEIGSPPSVERAQALTQRLPVSVRIDGPLVHWASNDPGHAEEWDHDRRYDGRPRLLERITADGHRVTLGLGDLPWKTLSLALVHLQHLGGLVMVDLDRVRLRLALRNLLDNGRWRNAAAQRGRPACLWRPEEHP